MELRATVGLCLVFEFWVGAVASAQTLPARPESEIGGKSASEATGLLQPIDPTRQVLPEDFNGLSWRSVGPANMGGRVADIAIAPGNSKTFFVAYGTGGLFKTTNRGTTFSPVFDKEATASIGSVVVADASPDWPGWKDEPPSSSEAQKADEQKDRGKGKIVWVGTGEGNGRNSSSWGTGVYRSTDGGASFVQVGLPDSHDIPRLAVDPRNPDVCYAAALGHLWGPNAERGVYKTSDGGKSWEAVLKIDENTGACDVMLDPQNPDTVFAAMYSRRRSAFSFVSGSKTGGIFRSTDGGKTWKKLTNGIPEQTGRIGLDVYPKNSKIVYAVVESDIEGRRVDEWNNMSMRGGVFRSEDGGDTWTRVSPWNPRGFYFAKVRVDPTDDQRVYLLGYGLWISDDGGKNFRAGGARKPHGDLHALVIDPQDRDFLVLGTDGGVYVSHDRAATWDFLNQLATGEFYNIAVDNSDPYRIMGGLQDNGTWIGPSATLRTSGWGEPSHDEIPACITNADWQFVSWGDGFHVAFDPLNKNIVYSESQGGVLMRTHLDTGRRKILKPAPREGQPRFRFNWNSPFLVSHHDPTCLYLGGNHVFKMTQRGDLWEKISDDLSTRAIERIMTVGSEAETHGTVVSLAESEIIQGHLWAGTDDGRVHFTANDGKTWADVTPPQTQGRYLSKIECSRHDLNTAYAALDGHRMDDMRPHVVVTRDQGQSWHDITGDLPQDGHVKVIREDRENPRMLYVGTERAAYMTNDGGEHWVKINGQSLPTVAVDDLVQHPREMDLVAGTHGRSIYILDDASPLSQLTPEVVQSAFHLFKVRPAKPRLFLPNEGFWDDRMFRASNPPMGARITYWIRDFSDDEVSIVIENDSGQPVRKLGGTNRRGLNRVVWDLQVEKYDRPDHPDAELGQSQFVPPGNYTVKLSIGKWKASRTFEVLPAPPE